MKAKINIQFKTTISKDDDGGYTAIADIFGAYGMGGTKKEAKESLYKSLDIIIEDCITNNRLLAALEQEGLSARVVLPKPTKNTSFEKLNYHIPLCHTSRAQRLHA